MKTISYIFTIFTIFLHRGNCSLLESITSSLENISEDGRLQFCELANKYGYDCIRYNVTTEDGYILGLYNIPGNTSHPVFLQHGVLDASDTFLVRTNGSLVAYLAAKGYDIWLGNMRGNMHSRAHETLDPDVDLTYWNFSFHEMAIYDIPVIIDFVLNKTGQTQLQVIAHSEGTTLFFVMLSVKTEYNSKISVVICLSPIVYLSNAEQPIFPIVSSTIGTALSEALSVVAFGELLGNSSEVVELVRVVCTQPVIGYQVCFEDIGFLVVGRDEEQLEPEFLETALGHFPGGTSNKNLIHLAQLVSRKEFAQFDYGSVENQVIYGSQDPPEYNLTEVSAGIALVIGLNDRFNDEEDIKMLESQLPNVVDHYVMESEKWNHIDYVWARNMTELFDHIYEILTTY